MRADSLTKALPKARFLDHIPLLGLEDITERLDTEKRAEELKDQWRNREKSDQETDTRDVVLVVGIKKARYWVGSLNWVQNEGVSEDTKAPQHHEEDP